MSLGSCPECWEDLCVCGYKWSMYPVKRRIDLIMAIAKSFGMRSISTHEYVYGKKPKEEKGEGE